MIPNSWKGLTKEKSNALVLFRITIHSYQIQIFFEVEMVVPFVNINMIKLISVNRIYFKAQHHSVGCPILSISFYVHHFPH